MLSNLWLAAKRLVVLAPGIIVAYLSARVVVPILDRRFPLPAAILGAYILGVYVFIPAIIRSWRYFIPAKHLTIYCVTPDGFASDPLNIGLIGSRKQLIEAMVACGWQVAKPVTVRSTITTGLALAFNRPYPGMPMSRLYLFGRKQDIGFEMQRTDKGRGHRHHVRFWATTLSDVHDSRLMPAQALNRREKLVANHLLWAGAASLDVGITVLRQSLQLAHAVGPDTNRERNLIAQQLQRQGKAVAISNFRLAKKYRLLNRAWASFLNSDGQMTILRLKP